MEPVNAILLVILLICCAAIVWVVKEVIREKIALRNKLVPEDVKEAANKYIGYPPEVDEGVSTLMRRDAYADGMLAERERLLARAIKANIFDVEDGSDASKLIVRIPGAKTGDEVYIIPKKEDEK